MAQVDTTLASLTSLLSVSPKPTLTSQDLARVTAERPQGNALEYIYRILSLLGQFDTQILATVTTGVTDVLRWQGFIAVAGDFPPLASREVGWTYFITAGGVTDPVTLQTFNLNDLIIWNGVDWTGVAGQTITNPVTFKGTIAVNTDFPNAADVAIGWLYVVQADVTDNAGPPHTNTGQSFVMGDEIVWNGVDWTNLGPAAFEAAAVSYDNAVSGLTATDAQAAIDELAARSPAQWPTEIITPSVGNTFAIDMDGSPYQTVNLTAPATNVIPSLTNLLAGRGKSVSVLLTNTTVGVLPFDWSNMSGFRVVGTLPVSMQASQSGVLAIDTYGLIPVLGYEVLSVQP